MGVLAWGARSRPRTLANLVQQAAFGQHLQLAPAASFRATRAGLAVGRRAACPLSPAVVLCAAVAAAGVAALGLSAGAARAAVLLLAADNEWARGAGMQLAALAAPFGRAYLWERARPLLEAELDSCVAAAEAGSMVPWLARMEGALLLLAELYKARGTPAAASDLAPVLAARLPALVSASARAYLYAGSLLARVAALAPDGGGLLELPLAPALLAALARADLHFQADAAVGLHAFSSSVAAAAVQDPRVATCLRTLLRSADGDVQLIAAKAAFQLTTSTYYRSAIAAPEVADVILSAVRSETTGTDTRLWLLDCLWKCVQDPAASELLMRNQRFTAAVEAAAALGPSVAVAGLRGAIARGRGM